ncbi:MAG: citramalate synthase [Clostridia bacterium]
MPMIELLDTTLRDGAQSEGVEHSLEDKRKIALALERLGIPLIEGGNPAANPKDEAFFEQARRMPFLTKSTLVPFGSTCRAGAPVEADAGLRTLLMTEQPVISLFGKADLRQVTEVLRVSPEQNLHMIEHSVAYLHSRGRRVLFDAEHFFDGAALNFDYAMEALRAALRGGADVLVLCDTKGGTLPSELGALTARVQALLAHTRLGIHCHDDMGMAVAGSLAAIQAGAAMAQVTVGGVGERCGNTSLSTLLPTLQCKLHYQVIPQECMELLTPISREILEVMNLPPERYAPYVGYSAFAHKGGMHIDGVMKASESFEHIPPEWVGNQRRFLLSDQTGRAGVYARLKRLLPEISREDPRVSKLTERLKRRESHGYAYESADGSFDLMALDTLGLRRRFFEVLDFHVLSGNAHDDHNAQAYIKIRVDGREEINAAEGDGPVNALDLALRKALLVFYPEIEHMRLRDFKVRVIDSGGTASTVRTLIESTDGQSVWNTMGVNSNIIQACFLALQDAVEYYLAFIR